MAECISSTSAQRWRARATSASDDVYTISSNDKLSITPFEDVGKSKLLKAGEELRNGDYQVDGNVFTFESAVYNQKTANGVLSDGAFHAQFRLAGEFKDDANRHII